MTDPIQYLFWIFTILKSHTQILKSHTQIPKSHTQISQQNTFIVPLKSKAQCWEMAFSHIIVYFNVYLLPLSLSSPTNYLWQHARILPYPNYKFHT